MAVVTSEGSSLHRELRPHLKKKSHERPIHGDADAEQSERCPQGRCLQVSVPCLQGRKEVGWRKGVWEHPTVCPATPVTSTIPVSPRMPLLAERFIPQARLLCEWQACHSP
ncbi:unnamed protein product [Lampetra fluviatilis]